MKVNFKQSWAQLVKLSEAHKPEMLTGCGVGLMLVSIPLAVIATVKTCKKVEEKKVEIAQELQSQSEDRDTPVDVNSITVPAKEVVKIGWKYYIPTLLSTVVGAACSVYSTKEGLKRTAAMAAAYHLSESALNEYKNATKEVVGDKKSEEIRQKIIKDRMELLTDDEGHIVNVYDTRDGTTLCFDYWSGRYFYSDIDFIRSQINLVNQMMLKEEQKVPGQGWASLNDIYRAIGLPDAGSADNMIWRVDKEGIIEISASSKLIDGDKQVWVLNFANPPRWAPPWLMDRM